MQTIETDLKRGEEMEKKGDRNTKFLNVFCSPVTVVCFHVITVTFIVAAKTAVILK